MNTLELGFIGLGRMGQNMVSKMLSSKKIKVITWNRDQEKVKQVETLGAVGVSDVETLIDTLKDTPKIVWLMLPAGKITEEFFQKAINLLNSGDIIIDGANSYYKDTLRRHKEANAKGIKMLDIGVSGGIIAAETGYPMMIGGERETFEHIKPILDSFGIKEGVDLVGGPGSGHYVKMIHNAIEYGMMQAISEGFDLLKNGSIKDLNLLKIAHLWNHGTIVSSFLMQMVENALKDDPNFNQIKPFVEDSGEGKWSAQEAITNSVPFVVNSYALQARFLSRDDNSYAFKMLAALRNEFGGHALKR